MKESAIPMTLEEVINQFNTILLRLSTYGQKVNKFDEMFATEVSLGNLKSESREALKTTLNLQPWQQE